MKWNKHLIWIVVSAFAIGGILNLWNSNIMQDFESKQKNREEIDSLQSIAFFIKESLLNQVHLSGNEMQNLATYIKNNTDIKERPLLLYRYSLTMCETCYNLDIDALSKYYSHFDKNRILILPAFDNTRDNRINVQNSLKEFNFINIGKDTIPIPIDKDKITHRFFAILDSCNFIHHIYFPSKSCPDMTYTYMDFILSEYPQLAYGK